MNNTSTSKRLLRGAENSTGILRNAPSFKHETHVPVTLATHRRMSASRQLGNSRVSRFCWLGMVVAPGFSDYRNGYSDDFRGDFVCDIRTASAIRAGGRFLIDVVKVEAFDVRFVNQTEDQSPPKAMAL
jgi:hypothetical protein